MYKGLKDLCAKENSDQSWLLKETNLRYLEDVELNYRREALKHAVLMLDLTIARIQQLKNKGEQ